MTTEREVCKKITDTSTRCQAKGGEMEVKADEFHGFCYNCGSHIRDVFVLEVGEVEEICLCLSCVILLRDLCHEATCEKDVTGKCDCWEGER